MKNSNKIFLSIFIFVLFAVFSLNAAQYKNKANFDTDQLAFDHFLEKRSFVKIWNDCLNWTETYKGTDFMRCVEAGWNLEFVPNVVSRMKNRAILRKSHMKDYISRKGLKRDSNVKKISKSPAHRKGEFKDIMWGITRIEALNSVIKAKDKILNKTVKYYIGKMHESTTPTYIKAKRDCMAQINFMKCMDQQFNTSTEKLSQSVLEGAVTVLSSKAMNRFDGLVLSKK